MFTHFPGYALGLGYEIFIFHQWEVLMRLKKH